MLSRQEISAKMTPLTARASLSSAMCLHILKGLPTPLEVRCQTVFILQNSVHFRLSEALMLPRHVTPLLCQTFHTQDYLKVMELFKVPIPDPAWKPNDWSKATIHGVWDIPPFTSFVFEGAATLKLHGIWGYKRHQTTCGGSQLWGKMSWLLCGWSGWDMSDMCY